MNSTEMNFRFSCVRFSLVHSAKCKQEQNVTKKDLAPKPR